MWPSLIRPKNRPGSDKDIQCTGPPRPAPSWLREPIKWHTALSSGDFQSYRICKQTATHRTFQSVRTGAEGLPKVLCVSNEPVFQTAWKTREGLRGLRGADRGREPGRGCLLRGVGSGCVPGGVFVCPPVGNWWVCGCVMTDEGRLWCNRRHVCVCDLRHRPSGLEGSWRWPGLGPGPCCLFLQVGKWRTGPSPSAGWSPDSSP